MTFPITHLQSLPANKYLELLSDPFVRPSFSQLGEDIIVWHLLQHFVPNVAQGFYVDVGAFHPKRYSNTRFLHMQGWRGMNIDANYESIDLFNVERPQDINICSGVGDQPGVMTYYKFGHGWNAANTISKNFATDIGTASGITTPTEETISVELLNTLLEKNLPSDISIDFMDIDVEGMDRVVSESLNLKKYRPKIISIELHDADLYDLKNDKTIQFYVNNNYRLMSINMQSFIFIDALIALK
jgi:hypothetical protein